MNFWLVNMCWPFSHQVLTQSYIRDSLAKSRFSIAWLQNLMRSWICVYLMFQWLKTILIWCISKTLVILIDYQTSIGFSQKSKFCYFLQNFLTKFLKDLLTKQAKIVIFSVFWSHFWICSRRHHIMICSLFWSVIIGCSSPRNLGVHVLHMPFYGNSSMLTFMVWTA